MKGGACLVVTLALLALARPGRAAESDPTARSNVAVQGGLFEYFNDAHRAGELGAQYRGSGRLWRLHPMVGGMVTTKGSFYLYAGFGLDAPLGSRLLLRLGLAPGYYHAGGGENLGSTLEFRSSAELAWRFGDGWRIGMEIDHVSNAGFGDGNPGGNSLLLTLTAPLGSP